MLARGCATILYFHCASIMTSNIEGVCNHDRLLGSQCLIIINQQRSHDLC